VRLKFCMHEDVKENVRGGVENLNTKMNMRRRIEIEYEAAAQVTGGEASPKAKIPDRDAKAVDEGTLNNWSLQISHA